jgi:hypothetical protein
MKVVIVYQRKKRTANREKGSVLCSFLKFLLCVTGVMSGFVFSAHLWAGGFGLEPMRIIGDSAWILLLTAVAYALLLLGFSSAAKPRRARPAVADFAGVMAFLLSFGFGVAGIRAALWVVA